MAQCEGGAASNNGSENGSGLCIDAAGAVTCARCGAAVGQLVQHEVVSLAVGAVELLALDGRCTACRRAVHYRSSRSLARILARRAGVSVLAAEIRLLNNGG